MELSAELLSQFTKVTNDETKNTKKESFVYGTTVVHEGRTYVKLDGSELLTPISTTTNTQDGERVTVMIKNHTATITGNISSPSARLVDISDQSDAITELEILIAGKVDTDVFIAEQGRVNDLVADNVSIRQLLTANDIIVKEIQAENVDIGKQLTAHDALIDNLEVTKLDAEVADLTYATISDLEATDADIHNLRATYGDFVELTTQELDAINAAIKDLDANTITVDYLKGNYATITELDVERGRITNLEADIGDVNTLIFGSATGNVIQTSFANAVIAQLGNAQIKSAMIESVSADKITAGDIITNNVRVMSEDGKLLISDETIQISDETRVRVQIGKDASGDYSINIWDVDGNLMFSEGGITDSAIKDAIIRNDMVSDTANISAHKLDIDSLFEEINGSTNTIKSTRVYLDDEGQTLDVAFTTMSTDMNELQNEVSSQGTQISVIQGQIASAIWQQDIDAATDEMSTQYSLLEQSIDEVNVIVANHTTDLASVNDQVAELEVSLDGFKTSVSETYATKSELSAIDIGGTNLILNSSFDDGGNSWSISTGRMSSYSYNANDFGGRNSFEWTVSDKTSNGWIGMSQYIAIDKFKNGGKFTLSGWAYVFSDVSIDASISVEVKRVKTDGSHAGYGTVNLHDDSFPRDEWFYFEKTYTLPIEDTTHYYVYPWIGMNGHVKISQLKFEEGITATSWSPAPEDIETRVTTAETSIEQNATAIELRATKTEVTKAINDIAIGGRNLIRDSKMDADTDMWALDLNHHTISFDNGYAEISRVYDSSYTNRTFNNQYSSSNPLLLPDEITGKTYVLQAELKAIEGIAPSKQSSVFWRVYYDDSADYEEVTLYIPEDLSETEWRRCYAVHTFGDKNWTSSQLTIALANVDNGICVRNMMLERATKPSTWSPAPEDIETRVTSAETKITQNADSITAVASRTSENENDIASLKLTADGLTSRVSATETEINDLEIGGRNLFENSAELSTGAVGRYFSPAVPPYTITMEEDSTAPSGSCAVCTVGEITTAITNGGFYLTEAFGKYASKMIEGETYTVSVWVKCNRDIAYGAMTAEFLTNGEVINKPNLSTEWQRYVIRGTYNGNTTSSVAITFYYNTLIQSNDVFYFSSPQVEKGNRATDWTVALEDLASAKDTELAQTTAEGAQETATRAETLIQQLSDSISMLVTDGNGTSLMTQTETGWTFSTAEIQSSISSAAESLDALNSELGDTNNTVNVLQQAVNDLGEIAEYVKISTYEDEPCIELGESDSEFKLRITNTRILFLEGSSIVAHITNQSLHIKKAVIEEELQQGGFVWKVRSNGNMGLVWKGVNN